MTDKQIIIDGVDVSGCPYYIDRDGSCSSHDCECIKCIHNVCFYKDYKAKEQECEESKSVRDMWMSKCEQETKTSEFFQDRFDKLKQTLTEIKGIAENFVKNVSDRCIETTPMYGVHKQIIQKCNEAISE